MDPKGDDSGSDTLDQSLQKKCVVADDDSSSKQPDPAVSEDNAAEEPTTEPGGIMSDPKDSPASPSPPPSSSSSSLLSSSQPQQLSTTDNNTFDAILAAVEDKEDLNDENSSSSGKDDSRGFESKVRQISDDLKDTTLADDNSLEKVDHDHHHDDDDDVTRNARTEQQPPADDSAVTVAVESVTLDPAISVKLENVNKNDSDGYDSDRTITYESPSKKSSSSSFEKKKSKKITKKVRFKYRQGKACSDDDADDDGADECDEDDVEEDDDEDEEDTLNEGDLSKKIRIPLSFVSPHDEDPDNLSDETSADEAEVVDPPPEGGIQNILGKLSQMGKIEYLFRWVDKPGLQWESKEVLNEMCPSLIRLYEKQRAREREQDMHYIMRRKKVRQDLRND